MRSLCSILLTLFALVSLASPAFAADPNLVDTKQGVTYIKPDAWVLAAPKKGAVSGLYASGDKKSQIEFRYAKISADRSASYFATFHSSLKKAHLDPVGATTAKTYGKIEGKLTEYQTAGRSLFVFEFTTAQGAWLVVGMFDKSKRENYLADYEKLLSGVVAE